MGSNLLSIQEDGHLILGLRSRAAVDEHLMNNNIMTKNMCTRTPIPE
jgi:hypothetical protein